MSPHATSIQMMEESAHLPANHQSESHEIPDRAGVERSILPSSNPEEIHDLICVGFGPASLAIAAALHDAVEFRRHELVGFEGRLPKVCFLERQEHFGWHPGMQLPGSKMQISWMKDLATMRNPRSRFTFLNYLHNMGRLVTFANLGTFLPFRMEFEDYLKWCSEWFNHLTSYEQECLEVVPDRDARNEQGIKSFLVKTRNLQTQRIETRRARHVVIAVGGKAKMPPYFPQNDPRVIHSATYRWNVSKILPDHEKPYKVVILGAGQSAAEVFNDLHSRFPNSSTYLVVKGSALKPSDDSPFVNEVFDPERVDDTFAEPPEIRSADIQEEKPTNYGVVRLELLEKLYWDLYEQQIRHPDPESRPHRILTHHTITSVEPADSSNQVRVHFEDSSGEHGKSQRPTTSWAMNVDAVIVAAGYARDVHEQLLKNARDVMPGGDEPSNTWKVRRDYRVEFEDGAVAPDAGVWLQGCNESTHGISDSLLSILATRGGEVVDSIFCSSGAEH